VVRAPWFQVARRGNGIPFVNGAPGTNVRPGPDQDIETENPVANQAAMLALTGLTVGDSVYRSDTDTNWVLLAQEESTLANWYQLPAGAPGQMTIYNNDGAPLTKNGPEGTFKWKGPNEVIAS
jgi:hypothetical protein